MPSQKRFVDTQIAMWLRPKKGMPDLLSAKAFRGSEEPIFDQDHIWLKTSYLFRSGRPPNFLTKDAFWNTAEPLTDEERTMTGGVLQDTVQGDRRYRYGIDVYSNFSHTVSLDIQAGNFLISLYHADERVGKRRGRLFRTIDLAPGWTTLHFYLVSANTRLRDSEPEGTDRLEVIAEGLGSTRLPTFVDLTPPIWRPAAAGGPLETGIIDADSGKAYVDAFWQISRDPSLTGWDVFKKAGRREVGTSRDVTSALEAGDNKMLRVETTGDQTFNYLLGQDLRVSSGGATSALGQIVDMGLFTSGGGTATLLTIDWDAETTGYWPWRFNHRALVSEDYNVLAFVPRTTNMLTSAYASWRDVTVATEEEVSYALDSAHWDGRHSARSTTQTIVGAADTTPPGNPTSVTGAAWQAWPQRPNKWVVDLRWNPPSRTVTQNRDLAGFVVYETSAVVAKRRKTVPWIYPDLDLDSNPPVSTQFTTTAFNQRHFVVTSIDRGGNESTGNRGLVVGDDGAPVAVRNLAGSVDHEISPPLVTLEFYQANAIDAAWARIQGQSPQGELLRVPATSSQFITHQWRDSRWTVGNSRIYWVWAEDYAGNLSSYEEIIVSKDVTGPSKPDGFAVQADGSLFRFYWTSPAETDFRYVKCWEAVGASRDLLFAHHGKPGDKDSFAYQKTGTSPVADSQLYILRAYDRFTNASSGTTASWTEARVYAWVSEAAGGSTSAGKFQQLGESTGQSLFPGTWNAPQIDTSATIPPVTGTDWITAPHLANLGAAIVGLEKQFHGERVWAGTVRVEGDYVYRTGPTTTAQYNAEMWRVRGVWSPGAAGIGNRTLGPCVFFTYPKPTSALDGTERLLLQSAAFHESMFARSAPPPFWGGPFGAKPGTIFSTYDTSGQVRVARPTWRDLLDDADPFIFASAIWPGSQVPGGKGLVPGVPYGPPSTTSTVIFSPALPDLSLLMGPGWAVPSVDPPVIINDARIVARFVQSGIPFAITTAKTFCVGGSFGGRIALEWAHTVPMSGAIILHPGPTDLKGDYYSTQQGFTTGHPWFGRPHSSPQQASAAWVGPATIMGPRTPQTGIDKTVRGINVQYGILTLAPYRAWNLCTMDHAPLCAEMYLESSCEDFVANYWASVRYWRNWSAWKPEVTWRPYFYSMEHLHTTATQDPDRVDPGVKNWVNPPKARHRNPHFLMDDVETSHDPHQMDYRRYFHIAGAGVGDVEAAYTSPPAASAEYIFKEKLTLTGVSGADVTLREPDPGGWFPTSSWSGRTNSTGWIVLPRAYCGYLHIDATHPDRDPIVGRQVFLPPEGRTSAHILWDPESAIVADLVGISVLLDPMTF